MPGWTLVDTHPTRGRTFQRPLKANEQTLTIKIPLERFNLDISRYLEIRLLNGNRDRNLFSNANITQAWVSTKRRYPLIGAILQLQEVPGVFSFGTDFVVHESDLSVLRPDEIVFREVVDAQEAQQQISAILLGPGQLSNELLVQLYVCREANSEKARGDILHVFVTMSHCVADEMASRAIVRCWLDMLARPDLEPPQMPLEDRLAMAAPMAELQPVPSHTLSAARRRWRRATAAVIVQLRTAKMQQSPAETHTLPHRRTPSTARSHSKGVGFVETSLTSSQSSAVITKCRQHKITFGNAYPVLAQVAMTRVLYRRYLRGDISEEEWTQRRRLPYVNDGQINMRPYQDKAWFERGGGGEFVPSVTEIRYKLPFMTLGRTDSEHDTQRPLSDGAPPFSDLLTFDRFLHRVGLVKKQAMAHLNHPLLLDINNVLNETILQNMHIYLQPYEDRGGESKSDEGQTRAVASISSDKTHKGSSFGNLDLTFPFEYPLPPTHALSPYSTVSHPSRAGYVAPSPSEQLISKADMTPTISVENQRFYLDALGGELYLSTETWRGKMKMFVYFDEGPFEEEVVREWLDEVREAVLWYLG